MLNFKNKQIKTDPFNYMVIDDFLDKEVFKKLQCQIRAMYANFDTNKLGRVIPTDRYDVSKNRGSSLVFGGLKDNQSVLDIINSSKADRDQSFSAAIKEAFSHRGYILLVLGFFVCGFQITLVGTHVPGYMQDRGMDGWSATIILALIGFFNIFGTLGIGYLGTKYRKKNLLSILYALRAVSICVFIFSPPSLVNSIIFGITFGLLWLSTVPPTNGIVAQIFGTKYLSTLFGIVFLCHQFGAFLGAYLGGYFYDLYGSYDNAWYIAIALSIFATLVHYPIDEKPLVRKERVFNIHS